LKYHFDRREKSFQLIDKERFLVSLEMT